MIEVKTIFEWLESAKEDADPKIIKLMGMMLNSYPHTATNLILNQVSRDSNAIFVQILDDAENIERSNDLYVKIPSSLRINDIAEKYPGLLRWNMAEGNVRLALNNNEGKIEDDKSFEFTPSE